MRMLHKIGDVKIIAAIIRKKKVRLFKKYIYMYVSKKLRWALEFLTLLFKNEKLYSE